MRHGRQRALTCVCCGPGFVRIGGGEVSLAEALELRKAAKERVGELSTQLADSAAPKVIHKEHRDIILDKRRMRTSTSSAREALSLIAKI